jgi:hypothetical protein
MKGLVIGVIFAAIYLLLAFAASGAGHATSLFFAVVFPYGLGLLLFPVIGFLAVNLNSFLTKSLLLVVLAIHYGLTFTFIKMFWVEDFPYFEKMWNYSPVSIILPVAFYISGNLVVYAAFIHSFRNETHDML